MRKCSLLILLFGAVLIGWHGTTQFVDKVQIGETNESSPARSTALAGRPTRYPVETNRTTELSTLELNTPAVASQLYDDRGAPPTSPIRQTVDLPITQTVNDPYRELRSVKQRSSLGIEDGSESEYRRQQFAKYMELAALSQGKADLAAAAVGTTDAEWAQETSELTAEEKFLRYVERARRSQQ